VSHKKRFRTNHILVVPRDQQNQNFIATYVSSPILERQNLNNYPPPQALYLTSSIDDKQSKRRDCNLNSNSGQNKHKVRENVSGDPFLSPFFTALLK
jgi:hypothetical protein